MTPSLVVILVCVFLMAYDVGHILKFLFAICISSLVKMSLHVFCPYFNWIVLIFFFLQLSFLFFETGLHSVAYAVVQ